MRTLDAMTGGSIRRSVTITNPQGLHLRPIQAFVEAATKFQSSVSLSKDGAEPVNGKSMLNLLGMAADQGTVLVLEISGPDCEDAVQTLAEVLERTWLDDEGH
jgi:phosphocarrier protein